MNCLVGAQQVKTSAQQRRRLKQLHWDKIRAPQQGTVWARDNQPRVNLNFDELENLFQARICSSPPIFNCSPKIGLNQCRHTTAKHVAMGCTQECH